MKCTISWHEECLSNRKKSFARELAQLEFLKQEIKRMTDDILFLEEQIAEAKKRGLDGFDPDRFLNRQKERT